MASLQGSPSVPGKGWALSCEDRDGMEGSAASLGPHNAQGLCCGTLSAGTLSLGLRVRPCPRLSTGVKAESLRVAQMPPLSWRPRGTRVPGRSLL